MSTKLSQCPTCASYDVSRLHVADHAGKMDKCKRCNTQWPAKPGTLTAEQTGGMSEMALSGEGAMVISSKELAPAKEVPLGLTGLPTFEEIQTDEEIGKKPDGSPIFKTRRVPIGYFEKELIRNGHWTHRGARHALTGEHMEFDVGREDMDEAVTNFAELKSAGHMPYIPDEHHFGKPANANNQNGQVIDLKRRGDSLIATMKLVGEKALEKVLKNDVSVGILDGQSDDVVDAFGKKYKGRVLHHVTLTPNPNQPHLGPFIRIAASADTPARDVPVFELAGTQPNPAPSRKGSKMKAELATQVRAKLGIGADVTDEQIDDACATKALALSADLAAKTTDLTAKATALATLTTERDTLKTERDAAKADVTAKEQQVLSLSSDVPTNDPLALTLIARAFKTDRDQVIASGVISEAGMKEVDALLISNGKPTRQALALSAGSTDPFYSRLCEILRKHPGIKTNNGTQRPPGITPAIAASGDNGEMTIEQMAVAAAKATMKQHYPSATVAAK